MKLDFPIKTILAPLAEITDAPFRQIVRGFSSCLMFTEMISAAGAYQNNQKTLKMMKLKPSEQPLGVQLFGHSSAQLATAAKLAEDAGAKLIDINMGCPVKKIVSDGNGSALMKDETLAAHIVEAVAGAVRLPVSAKFRTGWTAETINAVPFAKALESAGASMLTVHGRTRSAFYSGLADWDIIGKVKAAVHIPVIGNGDIKSGTDAIARIKQTGVDGVMIGRAALGHPWLMGQIEAAVSGNPVPPPPSLDTQKQVLLQHLSLMLSYYGNPSGIYHFRKHLCWYVSGLRGASQFRELANHTADEGALIHAISDFYAQQEVVLLNS